jgi:hypothetical protein
MPLNHHTAPRQRTSFTAALRCALARLRKGLTFNGRTPVRMVTDAAAFIFQGKTPWATAKGHRHCASKGLAAAMAGAVIRGEVRVLSDCQRAL